MSATRSPFTDNVPNRQRNAELLKELIDIGVEIEEVKSETEKDLHNQRLSNLKQLLTDIKQDNWKYQSQPELLGLTNIDQ